MTAPKVPRKVCAMATASIAVLIITSLSGVAFADDETVADVVAKAEIAGAGESTPADAVTPVVEGRDGGATIELNGGDLAVTIDASAGASIAVSGQYAIVEGAAVTHAVSHPEPGVTRFSAILGAAVDDAPRWTFEPGTQLLLLDDGSVSISDGERFLGGIDAPWAVDADGQSLPTRYETSGSTLTQIVDTTDAVFPVVADPTVNFYGPYIQVHLNRHESITAVSGYAACAAILSKSPVPFAKALQIACAAVTAIGSAQLVAGKCISIHYVIGVGGPAGVWWPWTRNC